LKKEAVRKFKMDLDHFHSLKNDLVATCTLIAVSKGQPIDKIQALYDLGQRDFGENFLQELQSKKSELPKDIRWHFLGNIQSNKLHDVMNCSDLIHSISRKKIYNKLLSLDQEKENKILLQLKLGDESSKSGFTDHEIYEIIDLHPPNSPVLIKGLMVIAENNISADEITAQFHFAAEVFNKIKLLNENIETLSMGMSGDFNIALNAGSNMIRIGTSLFGERKK
jgi:pyridoxal phosphate enzyme (YggS family)